MTSSPCKLNNGLREIEGLPPLQLPEANLMEEMLQFFDAYLEHLEYIYIFYYEQSGKDKTDSKVASMRCDT